MVTPPDRRHRGFSRIGSASVLLAGAASVPLIGRYRFDRLVTRDVRLLFETAALSVGPPELRARMETLPPPLRRHLHYAIGDGAPALRTARLRHDGFFRTSPAGSWWPIAGEQYFTTARPGFVWAARVRPAPLVWVDARDALLHERGHMLVRALSAIPLANASGAEIDQGATLRWLAEAAWFPYALVSDCIQWEAIDDRSARATIRYEGPPASAVLEVDDEGKLVRARAERYRDLGGGRSALAAWGGEYRDYRRFNGFRVPASVEVAWNPGTGPDAVPMPEDMASFAYARFRVHTLDYNAIARF